MKPPHPKTRASIKSAIHNVHHRTADAGPRDAYAKSLRHASRQESRRLSSDLAAFLGMDEGETAETLEEIHDFLDQLGASDDES